MTHQTIDLIEAADTELTRISQEGMLSLTLEEMKAIQAYFKKAGRNPSDVELETLAQTWSEHCVHKTFKASYVYSEEILNGQASLATGQKKVYSNLLKQTIAKVTEQLSPKWCLSVFKDNAGVIDFDSKDAVSFKVETHNHPSALEPYGGAGTGIGGVIRDIVGCGLGGRPVLNTDVFCFGPLDTPDKDLNEGSLPPKRIATGVISGVRDYGNRMGIPTANGAVYFDPGYIGNPLVFCGTVGLMPHTAIDKTVKPGDLVVTAGGRTGRDGIHGATFSSAPLTSGITSSVVQIGHAIMEKKTTDAILIARDKNLYRSITDCGAGGFSSAVGELGQETGVEVNLEKIPLKYPGLSPWEMWVSESQERMVMAVPPEKWSELKTIFEQENVEAVVIGTFKDDNKLTIKYNEDVVASLDMEFLHNGVPPLNFNVTWNAAKHQIKHLEINPGFKPVPKKNYAGTLKALLKHPVIASKEVVVRQYDHEVQGGSIIKPFMGVEKDGPMDACVHRPKLNSWKGVGVSNGLNPEMGKIDPYLMALLAIDEAYRNLISVGGGLERTAILDNFCWGDSKDPNELAGLVRASEGCVEAATAYGLPFISGKDSFNNTWKSSDGTLHSIPPTLLISAIGVISDVRTCITSNFKEAGNLIYQVGQTKPGMRGALANHIWNEEAGDLPTLDLKQSKDLYDRLQKTMANQFVASCHDLSEGGMALALAEMSFGGMLGADIQLNNGDVNTQLYSETPSRFLVEVSPKNKKAFESHFDKSSITLLGKVTKAKTISMKQGKKTILKESIAPLKAIWKDALSSL